MVPVSYRGSSAAVADVVAPGQISEVRGQLPQEMKYLFAEPA